MAYPENVPEHRQPDQTVDCERRIAIQATPDPETGVIFQKAPDGGLRIAFQGQITIDLPPAVSETAGTALNTVSDVDYRLLPKSTPPLAEPVPSSHQEESEVPEVITHHITFTAAPDSVLRPSETPANGWLLESTKTPVSGPHSSPGVPSREGSRQQDPQSLHIPESENEKHEFVGNPVRDPAYWERRSGKRVAEFILATHPETEKTLYHRIRAFDRQAERVRDTVRKGQTGVEVVAYGPKYWPVTRRTKDGQEKREVVQGYYAGFVIVPKRYREEQPPSTQQPLE